MAEVLNYELKLNIEDFTECKDERNSERFWPFEGRDPVFDSFGKAYNPSCIVSYKGFGGRPKKERSVFHLKFDGALPKDFSVEWNCHIITSCNKMYEKFEKRYVEHNEVKLFSIHTGYGYLRVNDKLINFNHDDDYIGIEFSFRMYFNDLDPRKRRAPFPTIKVPPKRRCNLCTDFQNLYDSKEMSDVTIIVGDVTLLTHKLVLVTRSPVFKAMLDNDCLESNTKTIHITDVDASVFDKFLKYLYCSEIGDKSYDVVRNLYLLADKYAVDGLKEDCRDILEAELNKDTVCQLLEMSYLFPDETLKKMVVQFITHHFSEVSKKPEWIKICKDDPNMASDVLGMVTLFLNDKCQNQIKSE